LTHHDELEFLAALPGILAAHNVGDVVRLARSVVDVLRSRDHKLLDIVCNLTLYQIGHVLKVVHELRCEHPVSALSRSAGRALKVLRMSDDENLEIDLDDNDVRNLSSRAHCHAAATGEMRVLKSLNYMIYL
jgi:hypothetical protein